MKRCAAPASRPGGRVHLALIFQFAAQVALAGVEDIHDFGDRFLLFLRGAQVLAGDASLWPALNRVAVNTAVSKVLHGRSGLTLSTFNSHEHLEHDPALLTYR